MLLAPVPLCDLDDFWLAATPETAGFTPDLAGKLEAGLFSGLLQDLHAVLVSRGRQLVLERYDDGRDEAWGSPLGTISFGPETLHDLRSVTKSVVGLLYGIALDAGLAPPPEAPLLALFPPLLALFPKYADLADD